MTAARMRSDCAALPHHAAAPHQRGGDGNAPSIVTASGAVPTAASFEDFDARSRAHPSPSSARAPPPPGAERGSLQVELMAGFLLRMRLRASANSSNGEGLSE